MSDDFWGEPIYQYTDQDALNDGALVDLSQLGLRFRVMPEWHHIARVVEQFIGTSFLTGD